MEEQILSLCWKDHTSELTSVYKSLLENNFLVDCTIFAEGQSLKAHRLVLSACSPYFHTLFHKETGSNTLVILIDASFAALKALIDFVYQGETQVSEGDLKSFLTLAQSLQIKGLNAFSKDEDDSKNVASNTTTTTNNPQASVEDNQDTCEAQSISANQEDSPENFQVHHHYLESYPDTVHTNSSDPFVGYSDSCGETCPPNEYQTPPECDEGPVDTGVIVKHESLYAASSETRNSKLDNVMNDKPMSENFMSETDQGSASVFDEQDFNQNSGCIGTSFGNVDSVTPSSQQQLVQLTTEESSDQNVAEQGSERLLPENDLATQERHGSRPRSGAVQEGVATDELPLHPALPMHEGRRAPKRQRLGEEPRARRKALSTNAGHSSNFTPFRCDLCGLTLCSQRALMDHTYRHTGERPYTCDFCNKGFIQKQDLASHRRTHTGERPYRCDVCGDAFARSDTLANHKRSRHTSERPFRCDECGRSFTRASLRDSHKRVHRSAQ